VVRTSTWYRLLPLASDRVREMQTQPDEAERRRRIRRSAAWLVLLALTFYAGFIALGLMRSLS